MSHRLFVALRPPEAARDALIDTMEGLEGARWQDDGQLHLTLRFIGNVDTPLANDVAHALGEVRMAPFRIAVSGVGHFARKGLPTATWAGIAPTAELRALHDRVETACRRAGCVPETRKFQPHITLARLNRSSEPVGGWMAANGPLRSDPWIVDAFILYESYLGASGSLYEPVMRYQLNQ